MHDTPRLQVWLLATLCLLLLTTTATAQQLPPPAAWLGYELGARYTLHHRVVDYFRHIAEGNSNVQVLEYGETYEGRPLLVGVVSSPENIRNLEEIRMNNLRRAGRAEGTAQDGPVIVWLSYNIHGNEASPTETAMQVLYDLASGQMLSARQLEDVVVMIDPCVNPDGHDRYVNFWAGRYGTSQNPSTSHWTHTEPWPGGRPNHYLFDLNRDWVWQTQQESAQRAALYLSWLPHVHADYHEQFQNSPYYFAPAAKPYHRVITPWQREFQVLVGAKNAEYFDSEGWLYFTDEAFDLLYPSYGDTWPLYNGAIGFTYEQAGHTQSGVGVKTEVGDTLTLADRIAHHYTTSKATIEVSLAAKQKMLQEFGDYFRSAINNGNGAYRAYVLKARTQDEQRLDALLAFLERQQISWRYVQTGSQASGYSYSQKGEQRVALANGDIVVPTTQPHGAMVRVLFEPETALEDSNTYDLTAWSLPYAYNLEAYALKEMPAGLSNGPLQREGNGPGTNGQARLVEATHYILPWRGVDDARVLSLLHKAGLKVRSARAPFTVAGERYAPGTIIITAADNRKGGALTPRLQQVLGAEVHKLVPVQTGLTSVGPDFGSGNFEYLPAPKVVLVAGESTRYTDVGEVWFFFDHVLGYPITIVTEDNLARVNWQDVNVLVMASGSYRNIDEGLEEQLSEWVQGGGRIVGLGGALGALSGLEISQLKGKRPKSQEKDKDEDESEKLVAYGSQTSSYLTQTIPGAIYKVKLDGSHPLAYGYQGNNYYSLRTSSRSWAYLERGWNVGAVLPESHMAGFVGAQAQPLQDHSLMLGVQPVGRGQLVYFVDNPLVRHFWVGGHLLFANAIFQLN